jgi:hypothetical protein
LRDDAAACGRGAAARRVDEDGEPRRVKLHPRASNRAR